MMRGSYGGISLAVGSHRRLLASINRVFCSIKSSGELLYYYNEYTFQSANALSARQYPDWCCLRVNIIHNGGRRQSFVFYNALIS